MLGLVLAAGCGQQEPDSYTAKVKRSFLEGCTGQAQTDSGVDTSATSGTGSGTGNKVQLGDQKTCECVYARLVKNVDIKAFKKANSSLQEKPDQTLPKVIADQVTPCQQPTSATTGTSTPGGSTPATAPSATTTAATTTAAPPASS